MAKTTITLREAAKDLGIGKTRFHFYTSIKLIKPVDNVSGVFLFDKKDLYRTIKTVDALKGVCSLEEVKKVLKSPPKDLRGAIKKMKEKKLAEKKKREEARKKKKRTKKK